MSALMGKTCDEIENNKINYAKEFSLRYNVNMVLKGCNTIVCDKKGNIFVNAKQNVGMAKGGSGDVLSGIIASFLAQKVFYVNTYHKSNSFMKPSLSGERRKKPADRRLVFPTE